LGEKIAERKKQQVKLASEALQFWTMLKKYAPEAADALLEEAEATGRSVEEIIASAIQFRHLALQTLRANLTLDQLWVAFEFWDTIYRRALQTAFISTGLWRAFAEIFSSFLETYSGIYLSAKQAQTEDAQAMLVKEFTKMMKTMMKRMEQVQKNLTPILGVQANQLIQPYDIVKPKKSSKSSKKKEEVKIE